MTLNDAIEQFELLHTLDKVLEDGDRQIELCSGGERKLGKPLPALYADPSDAIDAWLYSARTLAPRRSRFCWVSRPRLDTYQITMTDAKRTHRVAADRHVVTSTLILSETA